MDNKDFLIKEETLTNIAENIRNVDSTLDKMTPTEMADEIKRLTAVIDQRYNASSTNPQAGIAVAEGIQQERERAQLAEEQNEQNIINETAERKAEDEKIVEAINAEKSSREENDGLLDEKITNLNNLLQAETVNRENADNSLSERIDTNKKAITQEIIDRKAADENLAQQIASITAVQIRNKSEVINSTEAEVQTTATQYIIDNYQRQPQNFDGLIITVTDKNNDKILYIYSEVSKLWINSGINNVDLSNYYTKNEVDTKIDALNKQIVSFDIYSSKTEFTTVDVLIPSK